MEVYDNAILIAYRHHQTQRRRYWLVIMAVTRRHVVTPLILLLGAVRCQPVRRVTFIVVDRMAYRTALTGYWHHYHITSGDWYHGVILRHMNFAAAGGYILPDDGLMAVTRIRERGTRMVVARRCARYSRHTRLRDVTSSHAPRRWLTLLSSIKAYYRGDEQMAIHGHIHALARYGVVTTLSLRVVALALYARYWLASCHTQHYTCCRYHRVDIICRLLATAWPDESDAMSVGWLCRLLSEMLQAVIRHGIAAALPLNVAWSIRQHIMFSGEIKKDEYSLSLTRCVHYGIIILRLSLYATSRYIKIRRCTSSTCDYTITTPIYNITE